MRILIFSLFPMFFLFFGASYAQEIGHKTQIHKHKQYAKEKNPIPATEQSIEKGREIYGKHCDSCHGEEGAVKTKMSLTDDLVLHGDSDGEIFRIITDGVKGTQMDGFKKELTTEMRWHLVNYVKNLKSTSDAGKIGQRPGKQIRRINIKGYTLTYRLLNLSERGEMMKLMEGHSVLGMKKSADVTNHIMVYIQNTDGKIVAGDVAFLLTGPEGKDFRTVSMGMYGGYGSDISLKLKGVYKIKTKIIVEDIVRLDDEFTYQVN